jgi:hypothetical protein
MQLAGIQHITISPGLLKELATRDAGILKGELGEYFAQGPREKSWETIDYDGIVRNESTWKLAFTRSAFGTNQGKIVQAINYFCDFQERLHDLVGSYMN